MSPEQCRGAGEIDHRSDIYALACVMIAMLTGRPPFEGDGTGDLIVAHLQAAPPFAASRVPGIPPVVDAILQRCLAKDPADRFQTMAELAAELGAVDEQILQSRFTPPAGTPTLAPSVPSTGVTRGTGLGVGLAPPPSTPTTLTSASGNALAPGARPRRGARIAVIAGLGIGGGLVAVALAMHGGSATSGGGDRAATATAPAPPADAARTPAIADARLAAAPPIADARLAAAPPATQPHPAATSSAAGTPTAPHSSPHPRRPAHVRASNSHPSMPAVDRGD